MANCLPQNSVVAALEVSRLKMYLQTNSGKKSTVNIVILAPYLSTVGLILCVLARQKDTYFGTVVDMSDTNVFKWQKYHPLPSTVEKYLE